MMAVKENTKKMVKLWYTDKKMGKMAVLRFND